MGCAGEVGNASFSYRARSLLVSSHRRRSVGSPHGNFAVAPEAHRGPYEYSVPGKDKDFVPQFEA